MTTTGDQNLRLGVLALQMGLVSHEELLAGMQAWMQAPQRTLAWHLKAAGTLSEESQRKLELQFEEAERASVQEPSLASTIAGAPRSPDSTLPWTSAGMNSTRELSRQRFQILKPHAEGGLGRVSIAFDQRLERQVALKEIRPDRLGDPALRQRFINEAEITGQLEHPGIVPIYALEENEAGEPYYAMRFIQGRTLADAIAAYHAQPTIPAFRELLKQFIAVCQTIAFAHSRGVIHRDLKPSNVMLGDYGETLVVDWGLAKSIADEAHPESGPRGDSEGMNEGELTAAGQLVGTVLYMSPEQARGDTNGVGPAADVYALGAVLYAILTGQSPHAGTAEQIIAKLQTNQLPAPPRQRNARVPLPLDAVCLKALSPVAGARYPTASALAADVEHWLADEEVTAFAEPPSLRLRRWLRKHPRTVATLTASALLGLVSAVAIAGIVFASNRALTTANLNLVNANAAERRAKGEAQTNARRAADNAAKAEANASVAREQSQLALKSLESVIYNIQEKLKGVPRAGALQRELLEIALARLDEVSAQFTEQSVIDWGTAVALTDLGDVYLQIGTGSDGHVAERPLAAARRIYEQALDVYSSLAAAHPKDAQAQHDVASKVATIQGRLGDVSAREGRPAEARKQYHLCLAMLKKLATTDPDTSEFQVFQVYVLNKVGDLDLEAGRLEDAEGSYAEGLAKLQSLPTADRDITRIQRDLSTSIERVAIIYERRGERGEARQRYQEMLRIKQQIADTHPTDWLAQRELAVALGHMGDVSDRLDEKLDFYTKDAAIRRKLADADPDNVDTQRDLTISFDRLGSVSWQTGEHEAAVEQFTNGLNSRLRLAAIDPSNVQIQMDIVASHNNVATVRRGMKQYDLAIDSYTNGLRILQSLKSQKRLPSEQWIDLLQRSIEDCRKLMQDSAN